MYAKNIDIQPQNIDTKNIDIFFLDTMRLCEKKGNFMLFNLGYYKSYSKGLHFPKKLKK